MGVATLLRKWPLDELHGLPDDGNTYELLEGELFVTPAPAPAHELILARLDAILMPYAIAQGLVYAYRTRAVIRQRPVSEVEPDLFVSEAIRDYDQAPTPSLVVEVISPYTRRRARVQAFVLSRSPTHSRILGRRSRITQRSRRALGYRRRRHAGGTDVVASRLSRTPRFRGRAALRRDAVNSRPAARVAHDICKQMFQRLLVP